MSKITDTILENDLRSALEIMEMHAKLSVIFELLPPDRWTYALPLASEKR